MVCMCMEVPPTLDDIFKQLDKEMEELSQIVEQIGRKVSEGILSYIKGKIKENNGRITYLIYIDIWKKIEELVTEKREQIKKEKGLEVDYQSILREINLHELILEAYKELGYIGVYGGNYIQTMGNFGGVSGRFVIPRSLYILNRERKFEKRKDIWSVHEFRSNDFVMYEGFKKKEDVETFIKSHRKHYIK